MVIPTFFVLLENGCSLVDLLQRASVESSSCLMMDNGWFDSSVSMKFVIAFKDGLNVASERYDPPLFLKAANLSSQYLLSHMSFFVIISDNS